MCIIIAEAMAAINAFVQANYYSDIVERRAAAGNGNFMLHISKSAARTTRIWGTHTQKLFE